MYPVVQGYKEFVSYGLKLNLSDPVGFQNIGITASYSPNKLLPEMKDIMQDSITPTSTGKHMQQ
jgi:hypothetical protein